MAEPKKILGEDKTPPLVKAKPSGEVDPDDKTTVDKPKEGSPEVNAVTINTDERYNKKEMDKVKSLPSSQELKRVRKKKAKKKKSSGATNASASLDGKAKGTTAVTTGVTSTEAAQDTYPTGPGGSGNSGGNTSPPFTPISPPSPVPVFANTPTQPPPPTSGTNTNTQPTNPPPTITDRGTSKGLNVKPGAIKGYAYPGTYALGHAIKDAIPNLNRFTAFNDEYHQGTSSFHAKGLALDFTLTNGAAGAARAAQTVRDLLAQNGIKGLVINEYAHPSARATGGHIHVNYASAADAAKGQQVFGGGTGNYDPGAGGTDIAGSGPFNPENVRPGAVTMADRVRLAYAAGFSAADAVKMGAISQAESSGNSYAHNTNANTGDNSYGLWQINMIGNLGIQRDALFKQKIPGYTGRDSLFNPFINAQAAKLIADQQGLGAWSTYKNGSYGQYMGNAANGIGAGSEFAGGSSTGTSSGAGRYPSNANGLNVSGTSGAGGSSNPYAGGQPQDATFSLAQFIAQGLGAGAGVGFGAITSFTNPPVGASNPSAYTNGLALDFTIQDPTLEKSNTATQFIQNFFIANSIAGTVTNRYLTASPITSGYIHVEFLSQAAANKAYTLFAAITEFNTYSDGIYISNGA